MKWVLGGPEVDASKHFPCSRAAWRKGCDHAGAGGFTGAASACLLPIGHSGGRAEKGMRSTEQETAGCPLVGRTGFPGH